MDAAGSALTSALLRTALITVLTVVGFLVLWYESPAHGAWRARVHRWSQRVTGAPNLPWVRLSALVAVGAAAFALAASISWALGIYACGPTGPSDLLTLYSSGQAFLHGGDPFTISACGRNGNPVPAGMASVLLDALGSLAGPAGVLLVWGAVSSAILPLVWALSDTPRVTTVWVLASFLYLPVVALQVDGASLALVPLSVLLTLYLARQDWVSAAGVGGFLATGRFPAVFPILGATGRARHRRVLAFAVGLGLFAAVTAISFAIYGNSFLGPVFLLQFRRGGFALNLWGFLEGTGWVVPSTPVTVVQAGLTLALVGSVWVWGRSSLGAVAIVLTGTVLLAQFLSFDELVFLLPVALMGTRARWWLWGIGLVAISNYLLAFPSASPLPLSPVLTYGLDLLLTVLLLGLLYELIRQELGKRQAPAEGSGGPSAEEPRGKEGSGLRLDDPGVSPRGD